MKKTISILLAVAFIIFAFAACKNENKETETSSDTTTGHIESSAEPSGSNSDVATESTPAVTTEELSDSTTDSDDIDLPNIPW